MCNRYFFHSLKAGPHPWKYHLQWSKEYSMAYWACSEYWFSTSVPVCALLMHSFPLASGSFCMPKVSSENRCLHQEQRHRPNVFTQPIKNWGFHEIRLLASHNLLTNSSAQMIIQPPKRRFIFSTFHLRTLCRMCVSVFSAKLSV